MTNYTERRAERKELNHERRRGVTVRIVLFVLLGMAVVAFGGPLNIFWGLVAAFYFVKWSITLGKHIAGVVQRRHESKEKTCPSNRFLG